MVVVRMSYNEYTSWWGARGAALWWRLSWRSRHHHDDPSLKEFETLCLPCPVLSFTSQAQHLQPHTPKSGLGLLACLPCPVWPYFFPLTMNAQPHHTHTQGSRCRQPQKRPRWPARTCPKSLHSWRCPGSSTCTSPPSCPTHHASAWLRRAGRTWGRTGEVSAPSNCRMDFIVMLHGCPGCYGGSGTCCSSLFHKTLLSSFPWPLCRALAMASEKCL